MLVAVGGALVVLASALAPWSRSGSVSRNAFELAQAADDLGEVDGGLARLALFAWFAVPALVACVWLAATFVRPVLVAALAGTVAVMSLVAAGTVLASPLRPGWGPWLAIPAGAVTLLAAAGIALNLGNRRTEQRQQ
jgi:hypothetical protein